jgi:hypothetical protein
MAVKRFTKRNRKVSGKLSKKQSGGSSSVPYNSKYASPTYNQRWANQRWANQPHKHTPNRLEIVNRRKEYTTSKERESSTDAQPSFISKIKSLFKPKGQEMIFKPKPKTGKWKP